MNWKPTATHAPRQRRWYKFRIQVGIDEYTRECLAPYVDRQINALNVFDVRSEVRLKPA